MTIEFQTIDFQISTTQIDVPDFREWLNHHSSGFSWLLAHFYDGVVWGIFDGIRWILSNDDSSNANATVETLIEARVFGANRESFIWRHGTGFFERSIVDNNGSGATCFDEPQILWGTYGTSKLIGDQKFSQLSDGRQALSHIVPVPLDDLLFEEALGHRPLNLILRHYISQDPASGLAHVSMSRLVNLITLSPPQEESNAA